MWVCVSHRLNEILITREILQSATNEKHDEVVNLDKLQKILKRMVLSKRFLLALDDQEMSTGCYSRNVHPEEFSRYPELQVMGREIAARLNGSPLAAKAVGGRLKHNLDIKEWKTILEREVWDDIMPVLISSYQNLPVQLQRCFAYCSIFPKDWKFEPKKLVNLWIAQDFIQSGNMMERRMEDVGRDYFDDLLSRSFFQTLKQGYCTYYVIPDLMHDLAQSVSMDECCRIEGDRFNRRIPPTVRHISVTTNHLDLDQLKNICELKNMRTVIVFKESDFNVDHFRDDILRELKGVRTLDLTGCDIEELQEAIAGIGKLTCLQGSLEFHVKNRRGQNIGEPKDMKELQGQLTIKNPDDVKSKEEAAEADLLNKKHIKKLRLEWDFCGRTCRPIADADVLGGLRPNPSLKELHITRYNSQPPFVSRIVQEPLSLYFKLSQLEVYDRNTDPVDHSGIFKASMLLQGASDVILYQAFPPTLKGAAR
ncbi:putative disease resistance protein RGA4 [Elaeis guineensis]|uniref:putative disease resistance protein RGA4 n=1 Tax=Elaeis guineensis var. tenera TaxID=51953 RepID=UPI003C6CEE34